MNLFDLLFEYFTQNSLQVDSSFRGRKTKHTQSKFESMSSINTTRTISSLRRSRKTIDFNTVGGLEHHLSVLKEVIIFPLIFSKLYSHFNIKPPRGVLFHGPPGTGKTFVAGALVAELNKLGLGKVNFYHRKGADILDKWVGESEKKLRELFEKAMKTQPSIIFFDELDGLAPQRSKNNDQIHASIVTTLLALMDGLDEMPGVIVIGATNRIESIDPALRRPGRFDKELYFPLPSTQARKEIIQVHTRFWGHPLSSDLIMKIAETTMGFSGSDIQALCTEAVLCCLKRSYPSVNTAVDLRRIRINLDTLKVEECDFMEACTNFIPWSEKSNVKARKLTAFVKPLLQRQLNNILKQLSLLWPHFLKPSYKYTVGQQRYAGRLLLIGSNLQGINNHLLPALLHVLEHLPAHVIEAPGQIKNTLKNARQNLPGIIVLSRIDTWWDFTENGVQAYLISVLEDLHAGLPLLLVATCTPEVPSVLLEYFYSNSSIVIKIDDPNTREREMFFSSLFFAESGPSVQSILKKQANSLKEKSAFERPALRLVSQRACTSCTRRYRSGSIFGSRLRGGAEDETLKRKRSKDVCIPSKRLKSSIMQTDVHKAPAFNHSKKAISLKTSKGNVLKKHLTTVLTEFALVERKDSFTMLYYNVNVDKALVCTEGSGDKRSVVNCYSSSTDRHKNSVYKLWKRVSNELTEGMSVNNLELLHDTITACININKDNFEKLLENLEKLLTQFGKPSS